MSQDVVIRLNGRPVMSAEQASKQADREWAGYRIAARLIEDEKKVNPSLSLSEVLALAAVASEAGSRGRIIGRAIRQAAKKGNRKGIRAIRPNMVSGSGRGSKFEAVDGPEPTGVEMPLAAVKPLPSPIVTTARVRPVETLSAGKREKARARWMGTRIHTPATEGSQAIPAIRDYQLVADGCWPGRYFYQGKLGPLVDAGWQASHYSESHPF